MERFEGRFRTQYDGGDLQNENCTAASLAMALHQVSEGRIDTTGSEVRALIARNDEVDPSTKGWALGDVDEAVIRLTKQKKVAGIKRPGNHAWSRVVALRAEGHGIILQGHSSRFPNTSCSGKFDGEHCVYLPPLNHSDGRWRLGDPVCSTWRWEDPEILRQYAEKFAGKGKASFRFTDTIKLAQPVQTFTWSDGSVMGTLTIDAPRVYLRFFDNSLHTVEPPFEKRALGPVKLRTPFNGVTTAGDRVTGFLVHDEAAFILAADVHFVPDH